MKRILIAAGLIVALPLLAKSQVAVLRIQVLEGEGAVNPAGARVPHPLAVEITDETGKPVEGAAVSFHLPDEGPTASFVNGLRTEVVLTDSRGRASLRGMQLDRTPGRLAIRIVASKEQARAGMVSFQYIAESKKGTASASAPQSRPSLLRSPLTWLVVAAVAGGVSALAAGHSGGSASTAPSAAAATSTASVPVQAGITIGTPSLTVGKP